MKKRHTLPLRFRILHYSATVEKFDINDLIHDLNDEYHGEGQFTQKGLSLHCDTLRACGLLEEKEVNVNDDGSLRIVYALTQYGRERLSYLPDEWKLE